MNKKVSILTPVYNGENYVERFLKSVVSQTYKNIQLIIIDDGSKDGTRKIIEKYVEMKHEGLEIKYIYQENAGQAAAIGNGIKYVKGEYLAWADSDDYYTDDAISKMVDFLEKNKEFAIVRCNAIGRAENDLNTVVQKMFLPKEFQNKTDVFEDCILINGINSFIGIYMMRFEKYKENNTNLYIYPGREGQNWQLLLPILYKNKCGFLDEIVYNYVVRDNSHSHAKRTLEQLIKRIEGYKKTLFETLKILNIEERYHNELVSKIEEKYNIEMFYIYARAFEKNNVKEKYSNIKRKSFRIKLFYSIGTIKFINKLYSFYVGLRLKK